MTPNARGGLVAVLGFVAYLFARPFMPWTTAAVVGVLVGVATAIVSRRWLVVEESDQDEQGPPPRSGLGLGLGLAAGAIAALAAILLVGSQPAGAIALALVAVGLAAASATIWQRDRAAR